MEHSIAQAIRTVGAQICRRLDVLIEAAGKPPVQDIEGTPAPRKPLAPATFKKQNTPVATAPAKKRGRPCRVKPSEGSSPTVFAASPTSPKRKRQAKSKQIVTLPSKSGSESGSASALDDQASFNENAEVKPHFFFVIFFLISCQVFYCKKHDLFSLIHGQEAFMKETYVGEEMLVFDVTNEELEMAKSGENKCICFQWVCIVFVVCFLLAK